MSYADIPGYCDFYPIYLAAVRDAPKGATLVEVGVFLGHSLAYLARCALDSGRDDLTLVGIDPWEWNGTHPDVQAVLDEAGGKSRDAFDLMMRRHAPEELARVNVLQAKSADIHHPAWFVFVDADHSYEGVRDDIAHWEPLVAPGGILAGHDHTDQFPGVKRACVEAFGADGYRVQGTSWVRK